MVRIWDLPSTFCFASGIPTPGINSLLAWDEDLAADTALVAKLKVGKEPLEARTWNWVLPRGRNSSEHILTSLWVWDYYVDVNVDVYTS